MRNSTYIFSAAVAVSAIVGIGTASAADLAPRSVHRRRRPRVVAVYDWTGFYVGGNIGYSWGRSSDGSTLHPVAPGRCCLPARTDRI